jgi:hypothetical protein
LRGRLENDQEIMEDGTPVATEDENSAEDYQLARALDLLRGLAMFGAREIQ